MMEQSDNRMTDAIYNRYGSAALNGTADTLGMADTQLNHRIGCTWEAAGQVKASNELTLADAGKLYEAVYRANSPYLGTGVARDKFTELADPGTWIFSSVLKQEADALGMSVTDRNAFAAKMWGAFKPGGYANAAEGATCNESGCTALLMRTTGGGMVSLPYRSFNGVETERKYVYGAFIDGAIDCGLGSSTDCSQESAAMFPAVQASMAELLRPHLKSALASFMPQRAGN
ncbi:serine hydrolase [Micromonospora sp. NPDC049645]|uniref:serine hydrolase n=1 Tax=Micromonospora sp. NPDC049645 TaxID=3155508 RepID=UPI00342C7ADA